MSVTGRELTAQFLSEIYLPLLAHLVLFGLLLTLMWGTVPTPLLAGWGGTVVGVSVIRAILWNVVRRKNLRARSYPPSARVSRACD